MPHPLPVIPNVYRITLNWESGAMKAANVMHILAIASTPAAVFAILDAHVTTNMWDQTTAGAEITSVDIIPLDGVTGRQSFIPTSPGNWSGAGSGDLIPAQAAILKLSTGFRGRSRRGRLFLPWVGEGKQAGGFLGGTEQAAMQAAWVIFNNAVTASSMNLVVASYKNSDSASVAHINVESALGTQRRRQSRLR